MSKHGRFVLVTLDYPPERGGVARYLGNLVKASEGVIDTVFVPEGHLSEGPGAIQRVPFFWPIWPTWAPLIRLFYRLGREDDRSALISQVLPVGTAAWLASWIGGTQYSIILHGLDLRLAQRSLQKRWLLRHILVRAEAVFVNSAFVAKEVRELGHSLEPIILLPGVEEIPFPTRADARARFALPEGRFQLLAVARLVPRKGIDRLIDALALLPESVYLTVIGSGLDEARLRERALSLGDRVRFETVASDEDRNAWYAASDIFVLPTRDEGRDVEGFGIVFIEAALAGLPVVAGRGGGVEEAVIDGETGLLVDPENSEAIAQAIEQLRRDPALMQRYGQHGQDRVKRFFRWSDRAATVLKTLGI
ncbi:glycosyltransferase family 4 protein [Patescibacteria group bacterium]|nr:glycosyltransferase family 4 protein [Patescibacteria group bacterium]